ncbi:unnamed protein product [Lampetra planeri]
MEETREEEAKRAQDQIQRIQKELLKVVRSFIEEEDGPYRWQNTFRGPGQDPEFSVMPGHAEAPASADMLSPAKIARLTERAFEFLFAQAGLAKRYESSPDRMTAFFHGHLKAPESILKSWKDDAAFCRQFTQGPNPMMISVCRSLREVPWEMRGLAGQGCTVPQLLEQGRLFVADYKQLAGLPLLPQDKKKFCAPLVLMFRELQPAQGSSRLMPLGIQLTRHTDRENPVHTPHKNPRRFLFAKMHVGCADNQVHQFVSHLGLTHLLLEPFAVALHNHLRGGHPVGQLLHPHFQDTLGINHVARHTLISSVAPLTDATFAVGTAGGMRMVARALRSARFVDRSFPVEMERRGFGADGLDDFYYRDDAARLWDALRAYAAAVVGRTYRDDDAVTADSALQDFAEAVVDPDRGNVLGFPAALCTRELLTECLTTIIFTASVQHSALNYPQWDFYSYVPMRPEHLTKLMPEGEEDISEEFITSALPDVRVCLFQILLSHILSVPSLTTLSQVDAMSELYPDVHADLQRRLRLISASIQQRNRQLEAAGATPYPYLDPAKVAASIDI